MPSYSSPDISFNIVLVRAGLDSIACAISVVLDNQFPFKYGIVPQYYVEGNHEAIIPKDIFLRVQEDLIRKRVVKTSANGKKRSYSCNHCFAQIVICGECGEMFRRIHWNNRGCKSIVWRCISRLEPTGQECHARTVNEPVLENVVVQAINTLLGNKSTYQAQLQQNIAKVSRSAQQNTADGINERLQRLQKELLKKANNKEAYDEIADEVLVKRWLERIISGRTTSPWS